MLRFFQARRCLCQKHVRDGALDYTSRSHDLHVLLEMHPVVDKPVQ